MSSRLTKGWKRIREKWIEMEVEPLEVKSKWSENVWNEVLGKSKGCQVC
jgi:hypothetical protein